MLCERRPGRAGPTARRRHPAAFRHPSAGSSRRPSTTRLSYCPSLGPSGGGPVIIWRVSGKCDTDVRNEQVSCTFAPSQQKSRTSRFRILPRIVGRIVRRAAAPLPALPAHGRHRLELHRATVPAKRRSALRGRPPGRPSSRARSPRAVTVASWWHVVIASDLGGRRGKLDLPRYDYYDSRPLVVKAPAAWTRAAGNRPLPQGLRDQLRRRRRRLQPRCGRGKALARKRGFPLPWQK